MRVLGSPIGLLAAPWARPRACPAPPPPEAPGPAHTGRTNGRVGQRHAMRAVAQRRRRASLVEPPAMREQPEPRAHLGHLRHHERRLARAHFRQRELQDGPLGRHRRQQLVRQYLALAGGLLAHRALGLALGGGEGAVDAGPVAERTGCSKERRQGPAGQHSRAKVVAARDAARVLQQAPAAGKVERDRGPGAAGGLPGPLPPPPAHQMGQVSSPPNSRAARSTLDSGAGAAPPALGAMLLSVQAQAPQRMATGAGAGPLVLQPLHNCALGAECCCMQAGLHALSFRSGLRPAPRGTRHVSCLIAVAWA